MWQVWKRRAYRILMGYLAGKRPLGRPSTIYEHVGGKY